MNSYDDIKQFKERLNLEHIDYKDTSENDGHTPSQEWAIIKQVAGANNTVADDGIRQRMAGLPTSPVPVNKDEFRSAPLLQSVSQQLSAGRDSTVLPASVPASPAPPVDEARRNTDEEPRFRRLFRQKSASVDDNDQRRDTPLKPLLEAIALCR
ncbi:cellulose biosynthesis protein BcsO [Brenneria sp. 4F2]|nr:cellulose biosynthesis protein BcsO [Brenneria bubanii]